jgi:hypothetical protein
MGAEVNVLKNLQMKERRHDLTGSKPVPKAVGSRAAAPVLQRPFACATQGFLLPIPDDHVRRFQSG